MFINIFPIKIINIYTGTVIPFVGSSRGRINGKGSDANFDCPFGIAIDQQTGDLYVADMLNHLIRKISPQSMYLLLLFSCHYIILTAAYRRCLYTRRIRSWICGWRWRGSEV